MSSADTCVLTQSIILSEDVIKRVLPVREEKKTVWLTRLNLTVLSLVALGLALILKTVISSLLFAYTIFTCGLVVPVIAGFYRQRINVTSQGALIAMIGGGFTALLGRIPWLDIPLKGDLGLVGFGFSAVLLFAVSFLTRKGSRQRANP
jgi:SSS family solute:Na+ symporter